MKKRLSKILWYGEELPNPATSSDDLEGLHEGELFLHLKDDGVTLWSLSADGRVVEISGGGGGDLSQYLLKSIWDRVWEIKTDSQGNEYIFGKLPVVTQYGITMYADGGELNLPSIYAGIPFDNKTIWLNPETGKVEVIGGTGGVAGSVHWNNIEGKPSFASVATSGKYSDLSGLPDLSVYATTEYLTSELKKYVTIDGNEAINGLKNFTKGLQIDGLSITKSQDDVIYLDANLVVRGGITMFGTNSVDVPTIMDAIATDGVNLKVVDGVLTFVGSSGGGLSEVYWDDVIGRPTLLSSFIDDVGYLQKSGGQMMGGIGYTLTPDSYEVGLPAAGSIESLTGLDKLNSYKSFIGSVYTDDWYHVLSIRHRNGNDDGNKFGLLLYTTLTTNGNLEWNRQYNGSWTNSRVILDSYNWSQYVTAADGGSYLPLSGGSLSNNINSQVLNVSSTITTAEWLSPITAYAPNLQSGGHVNIQVGVESSPRNLAWMGLRYSGYGSSANMLSLGLYGVDDVLVINGNGCVGINNISPDYQLHIISDYHQVARFQSNTQSEASIAFRNRTGLSYVSGMMNSSYFVWSEQTNMYVIQIDSSGNGLFSGGITMYSDIRKKTKLQDVELSLKQIADAPLIEHYYNSDEKRTTHVGSIAQYWAGLNNWFCKLDGEGFYTMEIQNAALASAISIARELVKYESKTDKEIRMLKDEVKRLKKEIKILKSA